LARALAEAGYDTPTPIQAQAIPPLLDGRDLMGIAQTGTGKTAAFVLPLLQALSRERADRPSRTARALILAPTRELALQISENISTYGRHCGLRQLVVIGGVSLSKQAQAMARGTDILIATPGRLLDLVNQRKVFLDRAAHLVVDEADRMLDMGFIRDVRKIVAMLPRKRQTVLFSATMPAEIVALAHEILADPVRVEIAAETVAVDRIDQHVRHVADGTAKRSELIDLLADPTLARVIVFTRTKHGADRLAKQIGAAGVDAAAIHGNKSQVARQTALAAFRDGAARVLVATDLAARGIDVDDVTHVINFDLPHEPESYVHRIGRTARAGASGTAISFCAPEERPQLRDIERLLRLRLPVAGEQPAADVVQQMPRKPNVAGKATRKGRSRRRGQRRAA
jgi:ATP-dependent RNA helicase RhlE